MKYLFPILVLACVPVDVSRAAPAGAEEGKRQADPAADENLLRQARALRAKLGPTLTPEARRWLDEEARKLADAPDKVDVQADLRAKAKDLPLNDASLEYLIALAGELAEGDAQRQREQLQETLRMLERQQEALRRKAGGKETEAQAREIQAIEDQIAAVRARLRDAEERRTKVMAMLRVRIQAERKADALTVYEKAKRDDLGAQRPYPRAAPAVAAEGKHQAEPAVDAKFRERALALRAKVEPSLSPETRRWLTREARRLVVEPDKVDVLADLRTQAKNPDFAHMPIEDALMLMFAIVAEDSKKDTKTLLAEMDAIRKQKAALREAAAEMKETKETMKEALREEKAKAEQAKPGQPKPGAPGAGANISPKTAAGPRVSADRDPLLEQTRQMRETEMSFNLQYLQLQSQMQHENRSYTAISNIMKTKHDTVKNSISNVR